MSTSFTMIYLSKLLKKKDNNQNELTHHVIICICLILIKIINKLYIKITKKIQFTLQSLSWTFVFSFNETCMFFFYLRLKWISNRIWWPPKAIFDNPSQFYRHFEVRHTWKWCNLCKMKLKKKSFPGSGFLEQ